LSKLALLMLADMVAELRFCKFIPSRFEQVIGSSGKEGIPSVKLKLKDGSCVVLSGVIDRVDLYQNEDKIYIRVVDYKSGEHKFSLKDISSGMDIQLILYLFAMLSVDPHKYAVGGAEYLYTATEKGTTGVFRSGLMLEDDEIKDALDASADRRSTKKLTRQTEEEINGLIDEMKQAVVDVAERILAGEAQKTPSKDACRFCAIADHCDKAIRE
jgi:ATP-dependent helicase/nuclease subunit B